MHTHFFTELFVVATGKSRHRCVKNAAELAARIFVIEDIVGWIFLILANAIDAFNYVNSIFVSIEQCIYITQIASPSDLWLT
jgi:Kef-type K+ transport system membrane component KefB